MSSEPAANGAVEPGHREQLLMLATVTRRGLRGLYKTGITRMAAALAYRTIFSIIPMLAIGLLIFGSVVSEEQVESGVRRVLDFAGISQIEVQGTDLAPGEQGPVIPKDDGEMSAPEQEAASAAAEIEEIIADLVVRVNNTLKNLPTGWIALVTGLVLLYAAMSMIIEVEKSFNQVCGAPGGRSWTRRLLLYWTTLTLGGVLLTATFWAGDALASFVRGSGGSAIRSSLAGYGVSVLISTVLLLVAYLVIPNARLKFRPTLAGAFIAAVVWEMGKWGFTSYLRYSTGYAQFYGSLALLPLFMLWVYVTWVIVLLGLQSAYALQHYRRLVNGRGDAETGPRLVDPATAVAVAVATARAHHDGLSPDAGELALRLGVEPAVVEMLLRRMEKAGLVKRVVNADDDAGWVPARPADRIGLATVLAAVEDLDASRAVVGGVEASVLRGLSEARAAAAKGLTLGDAMPRKDTADRGIVGARDEGRGETPDPGGA